MEKEQQAGIVKTEVAVIWGDFFKAPQMTRILKLTT